MTSLPISSRPMYSRPACSTRALLPLLEASHGHIVFINLSAGKSANPGVGQFSATQHAVRAFAQSLRAEVNERGIRVTVVCPGRTVSPRQEAIHTAERTDLPARAGSCNPRMWRKWCCPP